MNGYYSCSSSYTRIPGIAVYAHIAYSCVYTWANLCGRTVPEGGANGHRRPRPAQLVGPGHQMIVQRAITSSASWPPGVWAARRALGLSVNAHAAQLSSSFIPAAGIYISKSRPVLFGAGTSTVHSNIVAVATEYFYDLYSIGNSTRSCSDTYAHHVIRRTFV